MALESPEKTLKIEFRDLSLLDTVIILLMSCSLVIFILTMSAKFLGQDTFDRLPDFLKDSYAALWSAGVVAGGALVGSVIDAMSRRDSTKANFVLYVLGITILIMLMIVGTVELGRRTSAPMIDAPVGAQRVDPKRTTTKPTNFQLRNRSFFGGSTPMQLEGAFEVRDGRVYGNVVGGRIGPYVPMFNTPQLQAVKLTSVSVHLCYLRVAGGVPMQAQTPEFAVESNRQSIAAVANSSASYTIPAFEFAFDTAGMETLGPPYLCALIEGETPGKFIIY